MKLLAPITAIIAAASATQIYMGQSAEGYANSAELYQSGLELQQRGLYSDQSQSKPIYVDNEAGHSSRPESEKTAKILAYEMENHGHQYKYSYETENGIKAQESGQTSEHGTVAHGAYSYKGDDGQTYTVTYTADENGFHPEGAHLPTPPPIPEAIQKSLEHNAKDEASGIYDDGKYKEQSSHSMSEGHQQHGASYQHLGYQAPSGHASGAELAYHAHGGHGSHSSGAELAYHAHAGHSGHASGAELAYHIPEGHGTHSSNVEIGYHTQSMHPSHPSGGESAYYALSGHSGGQLAHHGHSSHASGAELGYHAQTGHSGGAELYHSHIGHTSAPELSYHSHH